MARVGRTFAWIRIFVEGGSGNGTETYSVSICKMFLEFQSLIRNIDIFAEQSNKTLMHHPSKK